MHQCVKKQYYTLAIPGKFGWGRFHSAKAFAGVVIEIVGDHPLHNTVTFGEYSNPAVAEYMTSQIENDIRGIIVDLMEQYHLEYTHIHVVDAEIDEELSSYTAWSMACKIAFHVMMG